MKAVLCTGFGDASVLYVGEAPAPELKVGRVRIRVRASGVNRADIHQRQGNYPPPPGESEILGLEAAGEIVEIAQDVTTWRVGDRVMALAAGGGYASELCVDQGLVMPLPAPVSYAEGAAIPEAFITAHHNLFSLGGAEANSMALIHAGASGVGTAGIQLLRRIGARVFATVGSDEKALAVQQLGARAIHYRRERFDDIVRQETGGHGVEIILDPVGASYLAANFRSLAIDGRQIQIGLMGGRETTIDLGMLLTKRIQLMGSTLRPLPLARKRATVAAFRHQCLADFESGALRPIIDRVYPVSSVRDAQARMEANENIGKIILQWE
jgi:putative PIG3 family NAD(P)H quinone oxidoreductase